MAVAALAATARNLRIPFGPQFHTAASADATTDVAETTVFVDTRASAREGKRRLAALVFVPDPGSSSVTASNTNFWTVTVTAYAADGSGATVLTAATTKTASAGALAASHATRLPLTGTSRDLPVGGSVTLKLVHTSTPSAAFPAGAWALDFDLP